MEVEENLLTGIEVIDRDHKEIISYVESFCINEQESFDLDYYLDILKKIYNKCSSHFLTEELLMKEVDYPYLISHKIEHDKQLITIKTFIFMFVDSNLSKKNSLFDIIHDMLYDWLVPHVKQNDIIFANFYKTRISIS